MSTSKTTLNVPLTDGALARLTAAARILGEPVEELAARLLTADPTKLGAGQPASPAKPDLLIDAEDLRAGSVEDRHQLWWDLLELTGKLDGAAFEIRLVEKPDRKAGRWFALRSRREPPRR